MNRENRINNTLPVAREGFPFIFIGMVIFVIVACLGWTILTIAAGILTLFVIYFFRDPERRPPTEKNAVVTPADGRVLEIKPVEGKDNPLGRPAIKVSIFMSIFNVHVNRITHRGNHLRHFLPLGEIFVGEPGQSLRTE